MSRRAILALPALALLAACGTPQDRCISAVTRDQKVIDGLIAETEGNIARGYAIEETQRTQTTVEICSGFGDDPIDAVFCQVSRPTVERKAVAIDTKAERSKLASLRQKRAELTRATPAAIAQCQARYPEA